ncbi:MAG: hypothetical protein KDC97_13665, partial [Confluentibacter sp.]|nr:hypothetical protein [Confluentibacter sp.]
LPNSFIHFLFFWNFPPFLANGKPPRYSLYLFKTLLPFELYTSNHLSFGLQYVYAYLSFKKDAATIAFAGFPMGFYVK